MIPPDETTAEGMLEWKGEAQTDITDLGEEDLGQTMTCGSTAKANIAVLIGSDRGKVFAIEGEALIGRDISATVHLTERSVSRRHALISADHKGRFFLLDLDSRNGTKVNGALVTEKALELGDRIQFGPDCELIFTPRDGLAEQIRESQRLESLGSLAGGAAHDFNNLLVVFSSSLQYLVEHLSPGVRDDPSVQDAISDAQLALSRGQELTGQLKTYAKSGPSAGAPFDLSAVAVEVQRMARRTFPPTIDLNVDIEPNLFVVGVSSELHQVLMNLCLNARDAMPDGGMLSIQLRAISEGELSLTVSDTGTGIDPALLPRVFDPFFTTKRGTGTGLGLAIAQRIVKQMKGSISVESSPGRGTAFSARLPRHVEV